MKAKWMVDVAHSDLSFKIKYLMISEIGGSLPEFTLEVETFGHDFGQVSLVVLKANLKSLNTQNEGRNKHLRSSDFFDIEHHPFLKFTGSEFEKMGMQPRNHMSAFRKDFRLAGELVIKGITRPIVLEGYFGGTAVDATGQKKAGFSIRGKISRKDFGIDWNSSTPAGKFILDDEVQISANIQMIKQD